MIRSLVARRSVLTVLLLLIIGALAVTFFPRRPATPHITVEIAATPENTPAKLRTWPQWGGALNSADLAGDGFFDRNRSRTFASSFEPQFRRFVVALNARAFFPQPVRDHATDVLGPAQADEPARTAYLQFFE